MSTVNGTVTPTYEFVLDEAGKAEVTVPRLNLLGVPTVTTDMSDAIALVDLKDAVKAYMLKLSIATADSTGGIGTATIQIQDADANSMANEYALKVWTATTDKAVPAAITGFTVTTGVQLAPLVANATLAVQTNSLGVAVVEANNGGSGTIFIMAEINGLVVSAQLDIT